MRATAEREITQLRARAAREAEEKRAESAKLLTEAREKRDKEEGFHDGASGMTGSFARVRTNRNAPPR